MQTSKDIERNTKMEALEILKKLNTSFGPSGNEGEVAKKIRAMVRPYADDIKTDTMGNLICHVKGKGPKLMIAAHMDSIGLIVTHIEKNGMLRFGAVGGVHAADILSMPVRFKDGLTGVVNQNDDAKKPEIDSMFIDIGATTKAEAEKMVTLGDMAVWDTPVKALGKDYVASPYIDNRAGCAAAMLAMELLGNPKARKKALSYDTYFVFTVQEEVGLRGAKPASFGIDPEYGIVVDTTLVDDIPKSNHTGTSVLGGGAAIKVMDKSVICHPEMVEALSAKAKSKKIKYQLDVLKAGGTDAGEMRKNACGVWTGGVSVATRYIHSPQEVCSISDINSCAKLLAEFCK